ncbi:MAG TPA: hypothetical protein VLI92_02000 [Candidatus Saccharimonadales bacterium]|nr:hypothetical protein [Candidatus Saccharimonadales bacterium]
METWTLEEIRTELATMGGLEGAILDERSQRFLKNGNPYYIAGRWKDWLFMVSWVKTKFMSVSVLTIDVSQIIEAFTKISGRKPFCKYWDLRQGRKLITYEWSWVDENERYTELVREQKKGLIRL